MGLGVPVHGRLGLTKYIRMGPPIQKPIMMHKGVYIEGNRKYVLVRSIGHSNSNNVTVYHFDGTSLNRVDNNTDDRWPKIFFGLTPCGCRLTADDITDDIKKALGVDTDTVVSISGSSMGGIYNHMSKGFTSGTGVMMHGGHHAEGSMEGMYNHMGSKMSGSSDPAAGFSPGNGAMFTDMA